MSDIAAKKPTPKEVVKTLDTLLDMGAKSLTLSRVEVNALLDDYDKRGKRIKELEDILERVNGGVVCIR